MRRTRASLNTFDVELVMLTAASGTIPQHPSLRFKSVHTVRPIYAARVGLGYRALASIEDETAVWFWIGTHAEYDELLRTL